MMYYQTLLRLLQKKYDVQEYWMPNSGDCKNLPPIEGQTITK